MSKKIPQDSSVLIKKQDPKKAGKKPELDSENPEPKEEKREELEAIAILSSN